MMKNTVKLASLSVFFLFIISSFITSGINLSNEREYGVIVSSYTTTSLKGQLSTDDISTLKQRASIEGWSFEVGENSATNRPMDQLCGFKPDKKCSSSDSKSYASLKSSDFLPNRFDWRENNGVTSIKDQGNCGSCWAFSVVAVLESSILINDKKSVDLSEQWLVSCNQEAFWDNDTKEWIPWGCEGGGNFTAHDYHNWTGIKKGKCGGYGAVLESDFPYVAWDVECNGPYNHPYAIDDWSYICQNSHPAEDIKQAIYDHGPVSAAIYIDDEFRGYNGGIFNINEEHPEDSDYVNHAITVVGWDDTQGTNGVWFIKNSWGTNWGEDEFGNGWDEEHDGGYMRIEYNCSNVGYYSNYIEYSGRPGSSNETNNPPLVSNEKPTNNNFSVPLDISFVSVDITDEDGDLFNWSIETSPDIGNASATNDSSGVKICMIDGLESNVVYTWFVNATDYNGSGNWTRRKFSFKTESPPDKPIDPDPSNNQINVPLKPILFVKVYDPNGDMMNVSFYWYDGTLIGHDFNVTNTDRYAVFSIDEDLEYNTTYSWYVIAKDKKYSTQSETWNFTTWSKEYEDSLLEISLPIISWAGVKAKIKNTCGENILDANWSISIKGGLFGRINFTKQGFIDIDSDETEIISTWGLPLKDRIVRRFGFVNITIDIDVYGSNFVFYSKGFVFGRVVILFNN